MASLECRSNPPSPATQITPPVVIAQTRMILKEETESKPLQEQLPVTQIKSGPVEDDCKPVIAAPPTSAGANGGTAQPAGVRATILPTVPININLNDLQNVLRRLLGATNRVVTQGKQGNVVQQPQQQIISLPAFVDRDGTRKIIINYRISPAAGKTNPAPLPTVTTAAAPTPTPTKTEPSTPIKTETSTPTKTETSTPTKTEPSTPEVTDLSIVKAEPESVAITETETEAVTRTQMASDAQTGQAVDSAALDPSFATLLSGAGVKLEEPPVDDLLSLLKTYFASNANPGEDGQTKISEAVSIHVDVVRKWFAKMNSGEDVSHYLEKTTAVSTKTESNVSNQNGEAEKDSSQDTGDLVIVKTDPEDPDSVDSQAERLDLSVPKRIAAAVETTTPPAKQQEQPLSLTYLKKEQLEARTIYVTKPQNGRPINRVTAAQLRTLAAIAGHGRVRCLSAINTKTKSTILIPELTYATTAGSTTGAKTVILNGHKKADYVGSKAVQPPGLPRPMLPAAHRVTESPRPMTAKRRTRREKKLDSSSDGVPTEEEQNDSDSAALVKKRRLGRGALYPCDLCSKVFSKKFLLLRHEYEHTGKRPHECNVSEKAFEHKQRLMEHSGEKPDQCDKGAKRFPPPGSPSGHTREHFSSCRKIRLNFGSGSRPRRVLSKLGRTRRCAAVGPR